MTLLLGKSGTHSNAASGVRAVASLEVLKATVVLLAGFGLLTPVDLINIRSPGVKGKERWSSWFSFGVLNAPVSDASRWLWVSACVFYQDVISNATVML
jgi:hypothetical protein